jgi:hypothetical protein
MIQVFGLQTLSSTATDRSTIIECGFDLFPKLRGNSTATVLCKERCQQSSENLLFTSSGSEPDYVIRGRVAIPSQFDGDQYRERTSFICEVLF